MHDEPKQDLLPLCQAVRVGKVVFWVGAGFSEYAGYPTGKGFTKYLQQILGIPDDEKQLLSEVSEKFVNRDELLEIIKNVFGKEPEHTDAHKALALITQIPYFITTNFDMLFEKVYNDRIKSIADERELPTTAGISQNAFIYKIHGDISHLDHIIITSTDYQKFDSNSILWDKIKTILAEYSVVFIGYSLQDKNVKELLEFVLRRIGEHKNPYYFITREMSEDKQKFLQNYDIIPIIAEATNAIVQIKDYVARYAFIDSCVDPVLLIRNTRILEHEKVKVAFEVDQGQIRSCTVDTMPDSGVKNVATCQKLPTTPDSTEMRELFDLIEGDRFDSVTIKDPWLKINFEVNAGNVLLFNKNEANMQLEEVTITRQPTQTYLVDLQINQMRFSNVIVKEYDSGTHGQAVFEHEYFSFIFYGEKNQNGREITVEFGLKTTNIILDINKANEVFSFLKMWLDGQPMHIIRTPQELSSIIKLPPTINSELYSDIQFRQQFFEILSSIQKITKHKLIISDPISNDDLQKTFEIGNFLRGGKLQNKIRCQVTNISPDFLEVSKNMPPATIEGVMDFTLFGQKISLNYVVEGTNCAIENFDDVAVQVQQGNLPLNVVLISRNDDFHLRFKS